MEESHLNDIPNFIKELSIALCNDFNEIQKVIGTRSNLGKEIQLATTKMQNYMINIYLQKIHKIIFPENINDTDIVDNIFLDINLSLLIKLIMSQPWIELLPDDLNEDLVSFSDCIQANFKERQKVLKLLPPNTNLEVVPSPIIVTAFPSTSQMASTNTVPVASLKKDEKKATTSRQNALVKKTKKPEKKAIYKHVKPFQWRVQLRKKNKVVKRKQKLPKSPIPNVD